jgi:hypothetical protein
VEQTVVEAGSLSSSHAQLPSRKRQRPQQQSAAQQLLAIIHVHRCVLLPVSSSQHLADSHHVGPADWERGCCAAWAGAWPVASIGATQGQQGAASQQQLDSIPRRDQHIHIYSIHTVPTDTVPRRTASGSAGAASAPTTVSSPKELCARRARLGFQLRLASRFSAGAANGC